MRATAEEIAAMKARLAEKRDQRKLDQDIAEAIAIVQHRPFVQPVHTPVEPAAEKKTGSVSVVKYALWHFIRLILEDWLFWLVMGMALWVVSIIF